MAVIMYKDVKKKLLAVALSICMVIGVIEIVPRVRAAAGSPTITVNATYAGGSATETFTVKLDATSFMYDGTPQKPVIDSITGAGGKTYSASLFSLGAPESVNKGTYTATLQSGNSSWVFDAGSTLTTEYEITAAPITIITAQTSGQPVVYYTGDVVVPDKSSVTVTINGSTALSEDQFVIEGSQSAVGQATAKVRVTDGNYNQGSVVSNDISYIIAYNLGNTNANAGPVGILDNANVDYTPGTAITDPTMKFGSVLEVSRTSNPGNLFSVQYNRLTIDASGNIVDRTPVTGALTGAGEYEMIVTPRAGYEVAIVNNNYFTGTFTARFAVQRIGVDSLIVSANDAFGISHDLNGANAYRLQLSYANRDSEGRVRPSNIVVRTGQAANSPILPASDYTVTYRNDTQPGVAIMTITPNSNTDYTGSITIYYHITSSLYMEKTYITGENGGVDFEVNGEEPHIVYDGVWHTVDKQNSEVYAEGRNEKLTYGEEFDYTLSVQYWDGQNYQDVTSSNMEKLAEVGRKRIVITGHNTYEGQVAYQLFYIEPVDLSIPANRAKCRLELQPSTYYYNGSAIVPDFSFYYNNALVGTKADPQGNFTVSATNNVNAGDDARLTLRMTGTNFTGTYEAAFRILPLPINNLVIDGTYTYNGERQTPIYKIKVAGQDVDYTLVPGRDYELVGYRAAGSQGNWSTTAPTDAGTYEVQIRIITNNIDCGSGHTDTRNFDIDKCDIADIGSIAIAPEWLVGENNEVNWSGGATEPDITGVPSYMQPSDYVLTYENNTTITGSGKPAILHVKASDTSTNFTGQKDIEFTIISRNITSDGISFEIPKPENKTPNYILNLNVMDTNRVSGNQRLTLGKDYEINEVLCYNDSTGNWEPLQTDDNTAINYYGTGNNTITDLKRAGKYRVTIEGMNAYKGTRTAADVECGTDISAHIVRIDSAISGITNYKVPYNGTDQAPTGFSLREKAGNHNVVEGISYANGDFTVAYERTDTYDKLLQDVGRIFVVAVGNPEKGYFGKTESFFGSEGSGYYYDITPAKWTTGDNFEIQIEDVTYSPREVQTPVITLRFKTGATSSTGGAIWKTLELGTDYEITATNGIEYDESGNIILNNDLKNEGPKQLTIVGKGNYSGNSRAPLYHVLRKNIADSDIEVDTSEVNYSNLRNVRFRISHDGYQLVRDKDYTQTQKNDPVHGYNPIPNTDGTPGFHVFYTLTGIGNYQGKREDVEVKVGIVDLEPETVWAPKDEAQPGQFYVDWKQSELLITSDQAMLPETQRTPINPTQFDIMYKTETGSIPLERDVDYEIVPNGYGRNYTAGEADSNYVTIKGKGGYSGSPRLKFKLYTDISGAQTAEESLIKKYGDQDPICVITKTDWLEIYDGAHGSDKDLLILNQISIDEAGSIDPDEYELRWPTNFHPEDPAVGSWTVRVVGTQKGAHCYYGDILIPFRVVNDINAAEISVGGSNSIQYKGPNDPVLVTSPGVQFRVTADGRELREGRDYEIVGYTGNDRIGEATVTLRGIGDYSGEVDHKFKVVYPIASLVVFMWDPVSGAYVNRGKQNVTYAYTGKEVQPQIMLYCPLDFSGDATTDEEYLAKSPLDPSLYALGYENNIHAGTGTVVIKDCPYFTGGAGTTEEGAQRGVTFSIVAGNIAPPPAGTVSYTSSIHANVANIVVPYKGESYTVADLGIELSDHGEVLQENVDYAVYYDGDMQNVSGTNKDNWPRITFLGKGNYEGSEHAIRFEIIQKSISPDKSSDITANPIVLAYTDTATEQSIINQMSIVMGTPSGNTKKLVNGTDYEIENYFNDAMCHSPVSAANGMLRTDGNTYFPVAQGTYYARIRGIGNFTDRRTVTIEITKKDLTNDIQINFIPSASSDCMIDGNGEPDCTYNGREHKPAINVTYGRNNILLREESDYTVSYVNNVNAGTEAEVIIRMTPGGNYTGEFSRTFSIKPKSILQTEGGTILYSQINESYPFDPALSASIKPAITVRDSEMSQDAQELSPNTDYLIEYKSESAAIEEEDRANGINVPDCSYGGKVVIEITGQNNYTGTQKFAYYIGENIGDAYVQINGSNTAYATYNGLKQLIPESSIQVRTNSNDVPLELPDGTKRYGYAYYKGDLETMVEKEEVVDAGTYYIAVTGNPRLGTYAKSTVSNSSVYTINPRSISPSYILVSGYDASYYYTGQAIEPKAIVVEDTDLPVTLDSYDPQRRSVRLVNGVDYDLTYSNNVSAGKASIHVTGKGNYTGTRDAYFNIISSDSTGNNTWDGTSEGTGSLTNGTTTINASDIRLGLNNSAYNCMMYNGYEQIPIVSINGMNTNDFIITATNNVAPGMATLIIQGNGGNFTGTIYKPFMIKADLSRYGTIAGIADQVYSGYQITPSITLTCGGNLLTQGTDYTVTYANNTNVGRATVMAHATSNSYYVGTATGGFNISNAAGGMQVTGYASAYTYTGNAITPDVVVTMNNRVLNRGTDYTVSYANNINVGTASMTITGIGSYSGTRTINFTIEAKNIENCLTTEVSSYQYNGSTYTPVITVTDSSTGKTLVAGTDYTITYSNNTNPGTAQITVTALSKNYTGTKVIPFQITSAAVSGLRTSTIKNNSIKLAWSAQNYADGYQICNSKNQVVATTKKNSYTVKGLSSCTTYKFKVRSYVQNDDGTMSYGSFSTAISAKTLLNTPTLKVKASGGGRVTLTWTKVSKATGYEIYYSTKKNGKYTKLKTVSKSSKRKYVDKGLARGEKYYYTIRAYRTANGVKTYSNYNTIKSVKVK